MAIAGADPSVAPAPAAVRTRASGLASIARRVGAMFVVLLILSAGIFALTYLAPGSPERAITGGRPTDEATLQALRERYRLDDPLIVQYAAWLGNALTLDFGRSMRTNEEVTGTIVERGAVTLQLSLLAFVLALAAGLPLALLSAVRRRTPVDRAVSGGAALAVAAPPFALGVLLLYVFGVRLGWFPVFGAGEGFVDRLHHLVLPAIALAVGVVALMVKVGRAALVGALEQDYVTFARARGLGRAQVLMTYALRNSLGPIATAAGLTFGTLVVATVLVEETFALQGLGTLLIEAARNQDVPVVQGVSITIAAIVLLVNLATDIAYAIVDPRIDLSRSIA